MAIRFGWNQGGPPRDPDRPRPGFFLIRLRPRAILVPARILKWTTGEFQAIVNGVAREPHPDWVHAPYVERIWLGGKEVTQPEYEERLRYITRMAERNDHPAADPTQPVDLKKAGSLW